MERGEAGRSSWCNCMMRLRTGSGDPGTGRSLAAGAPERADAEVEEDGHDDGGGDKGAMVGSLGVAEAGAPEGGTEDQHGQEEKDAGYLKPQNAAHAGEGAQKPGEAAAEAAGLGGGADAGAWAGEGAAGLSGRGLRLGGRLHRVIDALTGDTARDAQPNSHYPANSLRSHFDMMVTAADGAALCTGFRAGASCPQTAMAVR